VDKPQSRNLQGRTSLEEYTDNPKKDSQHQRRSKKDRSKNSSIDSGPQQQNIKPETDTMVSEPYPISSIPQPTQIEKQPQKQSYAWLPAGDEGDEVVS